MKTLANFAVLAVALIHVYILILEMFLWESRLGLRTFNMDEDFAAATRTLAANQGLYNGFLAAGLLWAMGNGDIGAKEFFLGCVLVAGIYGALTANARILWVQAAPALLALVLVELA
jgi:putative membrane protein